LLLIKIGQGAYPAKPLQQKRDQLQPPNHRLKKEERQLVTSLLKLCCPDATPLMPSEDTATTSIDATMSLPDTTTNSTSTRCHKFNIHTPDKAALVMELVGGEMKSPEMVPVRRQLLGGGSKVIIHSLNNETKRYIHFPQCKDRASAHTAPLRNYKVVEQIVETVRAGITVTARMSPEGTAAMWNDALVTKTC
jgi:hypothetical protein